MKSSIKGFFVILVIVMSFVLVQGVYALDQDDIVSFTGTVTSDTSVDDRTIAIDENGDDNGETDVKIYHMGPLWYWDLFDGISYPEEGNVVQIDAFYCDILGDYVGVSVCMEDECILLRDEFTLKPLWNPKAKPTSDTAVEATGDGVPNDPKDNNLDWDKDYNWNGEQELHGK